MYISYEDVNIYNSLWAIKKAKNEKDYGNIYQNDLLGFSQAIQLQYDSENVYIANVFKREKASNDNLNKISLYTLQKWKECKVYVNPNGSDKSIENLQEVKIKDGNVNENNIDIDVGYHTIEFAEPIEITGDSFAVVLKLNAEGDTILPIEAKTTGGWEYSIVNANESFFTMDDGFDKNEWQDIALLENENLAYK